MQPEGFSAAIYTAARDSSWYRVCFMRKFVDCISCGNSRLVCEHTINSVVCPKCCATHVYETRLRFHKVGPENILVSYFKSVRLAKWGHNVDTNNESEEQKSVLQINEEEEEKSFDIRLKIGQECISREVPDFIKNCKSEFKDKYLKDFYTGYGLLYCVRCKNPDVMAFFRNSTATCSSCGSVYSYELYASTYIKENREVVSNVAIDHKKLLK